VRNSSGHSNAVVYNTSHDGVNRFENDFICCGEAMSSFGFGPSKKGRIPDVSMMTRNLKLVAQGKADATYADNQTKNPFRLSSAILNGGSYGSAIVAQQNTGVLPTPAVVGGGGCGTSDPIGTLQFNGTTLLRISKSTQGFQLGSGDFTIEWWMNMDSTNSGQYARVFSFSPADRAENEGVQYYGVSIEGSGTTRTFYLWNSNPNSGFVQEGNRLGQRSFVLDTTSFNTWRHFAIVGEGGGNKISVYVDGSLKMLVNLTIPYSMSSAVTSQLYIGSYYQNATPAVNVGFSGYIANFRIVKGTAVYTRPFIKPTSPLTNISGTTLLLLFASEADSRKDSSSDASAGSYVAIVIPGYSGPFWSIQNVF